MLSDFNKIVLHTATVLFIIVMLILGISFHQLTKDVAYPPVIAECPDYWEANKEQDGSTFCLNTMNLGGRSSDMCNKFYPDQFSGSKKQILCNKHKLARNCNLTWDGVTNNDRACKS